MKRAVVPILALALLTLPGHVDAQARGGGRGGFGMQNQITAIVNAADSLQLALTADQRTRLQTLATQVDQANAPRLQQIQGAAGGGGDPTAMMAVLQAIQTENQNAVQNARTNILTAEQWAKVEPFLANMGRGGRRGGGAGGARGGGGAPG